VILSWNQRSSNILIHVISFAVPTKLSQRLSSVYTYILRLDSFTRFLEQSGSMIHDIMYASSSRYHPSYHIILCPIGGDTRMFHTFFIPHHTSLTLTLTLTLNPIPLPPTHSQSVYRTPFPIPSRALAIPFLVTRLPRHLSYFLACTLKHFPS
jgi:hypothetical protein